MSMNSKINDHFIGVPYSTPMGVVSLENWHLVTLTAEMITKKR